MNPLQPFCAASLAMMLFVLPGALAQDKPAPRLVGTILKASLEDKNGLVVTATGQVNTGGWTNARLLRAHYDTPPADGIQDYFLLATPPDGFATQVISEVKASDSWKTYKKDAPWLKGVRIHGAEGSTVVKMVGGK